MPCYTYWYPFTAVEEHPLRSDIVQIRQDLIVQCSSHTAAVIRKQKVRRQSNTKSPCAYFASDAWSQSSKFDTCIVIYLRHFPKMKLAKNTVPLPRREFTIRCPSYIACTTKIGNKGAQQALESASLSAWRFSVEQRTILAKPDLPNMYTPFNLESLRNISLAISKIWKKCLLYTSCTLLLQLVVERLFLGLQPSSDVYLRR